MSTNGTLDYQINRFGFWSVIVVIVTSVVTLLFPLDIPDGYSAGHAERIAWLNDNRGDFIVGWINQIVAMFSLSAVMACGAWRIAAANPLRAILAAAFILMSVVAFIIPKFIAVWTIPMLADVIAQEAVGAELADPLLRLLNVSVPFSLYTSFDYLGFWLYGIFALLVAGPLYGESLGSKIAAVTFGVFGVLYQCLLIVLLVGEIAPADIESYFLGVAMLLLIPVVALGFVFRRLMSSRP